MATPLAPHKEHFPLAALLALAMTGFTCIVTETLPAGLLPQMSDGLGVTASTAGQTVTAYAAGSLLAAIPLTAMTATWRRRSVLLLTVVGFLVFNTLTAVSDHIALTLFARFMAGAAAGLAWSLLAGYARRMVHPTQQGKAMAVAMVGTPVALSLGVPAGTWMGALIGWKLAFAVMSGLTLVLIGWILAAVPDFAGQPRREGQGIRRVLRIPGIRPVLAVVFLWMLGHNVLYTYIAPLVAPAGLVDHVDTVLLTFGCAALAGIAISGKLVDHALRRAVLMSLGAFVLSALLLGLFRTAPWAIYIATAIWGVSFGGAATLLQTALADAAGNQADVALSLNVVTWNSAIAGGGIAGGLLLDHVGAASFAWCAGLLAIAALMVVVRSAKAGFRPGSRH